MTCKDCGATVTDTDRFCPACGTPNSASKFHPKFAPALRIVEPTIMSEPAPAGSPSCPSCHRLIKQGEEHCAACGMDLAAAWARIERVHLLDAWKQRRGYHLRPYQSMDPLARVLQLVLAGGVILATVAASGNLWLSARTSGLLMAGPPTADLRHALDAISYVGLATFALGLGLTMAWMRRAYLNLSALAVGDLRFDERWSINAWFVPGFNLIRPKQLMDDLWRASHPMAPPFSATWRVGPPPVWSTLWWSTFLVGAVLAVGSWLLAPEPEMMGPTGLQAPLAVAGLAALLLAGSATVLQTLVRRVSDRQAERAAFLLAGDLELPDIDAEPVPEGGGLVQPLRKEVVWGKY